MNANPSSSYIPNSIHRLLGARQPIKECLIKQASYFIVLQMNDLRHKSTVVHSEQVHVQCDIKLYFESYPFNYPL